MIADPNNEILISPASYRETAIKVSIGKISLVSTVRDVHHAGRRRQCDRRVDGINSVQESGGSEVGAGCHLAERPVRGLPDRCQTRRYEEHR